MADKDIQGEGDVKSANRYNEKTKDFVQEQGAGNLTNNNDHLGELSEGEASEAVDEASERARSTQSKESQ